MISRRDFIRFGALATLAALYPSLSEGNPELRLEEVLVPVKDLPKAFDSFRIGLLSDIHLGSFVHHEAVESAVLRLNEAKPDLVLLAGDYISVRDSLRSRRYGLSPNKYFDECPPPLLAHRQLNAAADLLQSCRASEGVAAVFGNHDRHVIRSARRAMFERREIRVLDNEVLSIKRGQDRLQVIGVEDLRYGRPRLPKLSRQKESGVTRVVLSHNPDFLSYVLRQNALDFDLGLAGHTHGGQIKLPLVGALEYNVRDERFAEGLVRRDSTAVYTSRGVGMVGIPLRINCPPEVTVLTLQRA